MLFKLQENITVYEVEELKISFQEHITQYNEIILDFIEVQKIDFAGISLILSLLKSCQEKSITLKLKNLNESILNNIKLCGTHIILEKYYE